MLAFRCGPSPLCANLSHRLRRTGSLASLLGIVGCGDGGGKEPKDPPEEPTSGTTFTVSSELASDIDSTAPTTVGIVRWSVDLPEIQSAFIEFGLDKKYGMRAPVDLAEPEFRTLLLGMKPLRAYHFRITANDGETAYASGDYVIQTGEPTTLVPIASFDLLDASAHERGFILGSFWRGAKNNVPFIMDADGDIVWWFARGFEGIARAARSADGKNVWMVSGSDAGRPLQRVTMDTLEDQTYESTRGSHDIAPVLGETMAYLDYGENDCDSIFEIDPSGATTEVFESEGIVDPDVGVSGCHGNSIHFHPDENTYSFSDRDQDILLVSRGGEVLWRLAELVEGGNAAWGAEQHGHELFPDSILLFANSAEGHDHSGVFEYTREGEEIMRYIGPTYSTTMGDVKRLPGGNLLLVYSNQSLIHEVDADRNVVLEIRGEGSTFGYVTWTESLYPEP